MKAPPSGRRDLRVGGRRIRSDGATVDDATVTRSDQGCSLLTGHRKPIYKIPSPRDPLGFAEPCFVSTSRRFWGWQLWTDGPSKRPMNVWSLALTATLTSRPAGTSSTSCATLSDAAECPRRSRPVREWTSSTRADSRRSLRRVVSCLNGTARSRSSIRVPVHNGFWISPAATNSSQSFDREMEAAATD